MIGSLPVGYWAARRIAGQDPRRASTYNLGIEASLHVMGVPALLVASFLDILKGYLAVYAASLVPSNEIEVAFLLAVMAYLGHLYPLSRLTPVLPMRAKGAALLIGILGGLSVTGVPYVWAFVPIVVGLTVYAISGYASLAGLSIPLALAVVASGLGFSAVAISLSWVLFVLSLWRYKENLGRILERLEPRLGDQLPLPSDKQVVCAFMIHPMTLDDLWQSPRFSWLRPLVRLGLVQPAWIEAVAEWFRPMKLGELRGVHTTDGREIRCYLLSAPLLPHQITEKPELAVRRAVQAAHLAKELGATTLGLGAFWSVVGDKGTQVQAQAPEIEVTNGGAYTAGTVKAAIPTLLRHYTEQGRELSQVTAAVVGANGVVAFGIARQIAPLVGKVILVGRDEERLTRSAQTLERMLVRKGSETELIVTTELERLSEADLIFTATSDPGPVIFARHVKPGTWIYDEGVPPDVHPEVAAVEGVRVIPGGVVRPPGDMKGNLDLHFGQAAVPACLAETMVLAAEEAFDRKSLGGETKSENIQFFVDRAAALGFEVVDGWDAPG